MLPPSAETARAVEAAGADLIDINMGCPARRVAGKLAGAALMQNLDAAARIIEAAAEAVQIPVTVKTRLGWDESRRNAAELARRAEATGAKMVTVHARTRCQFYNGAADWAAVGEIVEAVKIPVVINGDGKTVQDARKMLAASGASAVMIGRGAIGAPWRVGAISRALSSGGPLDRAVRAGSARRRARAPRKPSLHDGRTRRAQACAKTPRRLRRGGGRPGGAQPRTRHHRRSASARKRCSPARSTKNCGGAA